MGESGQTYEERFGVPFQLHVLACCSRIPGFVLRFRSALSHTYFADKVHAIVAKALFTHLDTYKLTPSHVTLLESCRDSAGAESMPYVEKLIEKLYAEDVSDAASVQAMVIEFGKTQAMVNAAVDVIDYINTGKRAKVLPRVREAQMVGEDLLSLGTDYTESVKDRAAYYLNPEVYADSIPTGIHHLDLAMGGGLGRGELGVVLAPPGRGKSTTLINFGFGALLSMDRHDVVHYTLEMKKSKVVERYDDRLMGHLVPTKRSDAQAYVEALSIRVRRFVRGRLIVQQYNTRSASPSTIRAHLTMLQAQGFRPSCLIVDYADIVKAERRLGETRHEQAGVYEDLRSIADEFDCAVWTGSQAVKSTLNAETGGTKEIITIADFAESFEKAAVVDAAVSFVQTASEISDKRCRLFLAKYRNREDGSTIECKIARDRCRIVSTGLYDAAGVRIGDDTQKTADATVERVHAATAAVKQSTGIGPQGKRPRVDKPTKRV